MGREMDAEQARKFVAAFADGELSVEQSLRVLEQMVMDPDLTKRVMHQQQLRQAVQRALGEEVAAPAGLCERLEAAMDESERAAELVGVTAETGADGRAVAHRWQVPALRWGSIAAVVSVMLVGAWQLGYGTGRGGQLGGDSTLMAAAQLSEFGRRHVECSRMVEMLMGRGKFPGRVSELPQAVSDYLGVKVRGIGLDLEGLGYAFEGAGECVVPGDRAVHIVYRAKAGSGRHDALSLWIHNYDGQPAIDEGKVYTLTGVDAAHPVLLWRRGATAYYLVGDAGGQVREAAGALLVG